MRPRWISATLIAMVAATASPAQQAPTLPLIKATDGGGPYRTNPMQCVDNAGKLIACGMERASSVTTGGAVAQANVFQLVMPANLKRVGCNIYNKSADTLLVYLGTPDAATAANGIPLRAGGSLMCGTPQGIVITDPISISGPNAGAAFVVVSQ